MLFFRRKHQKLDERSDELPQLRQSDISTRSGSDSVNSFDPSSYTYDTVAQNPIMTDLQRRSTEVYPSRIIPSDSKSRRFWKLGWTSPLRESSTRRRKKALAELDRTIMQIRGKNSFVDSSPSRSIPMKSGSGTRKNDAPFNHVANSTILPREVTWKRRVSSLEAFFKKECKTKYPTHRESSFESAITKVMPFDTSIGKSGPSFGNYEDHRDITKSKYSRPKRNSTFEETVERGVSDIIGKITSRGEEILESVPDWSVASSSVDFMSAATSDDDQTSISGYRQLDSSWSPTQRSTSSGEDDEFFMPDGGCNSIESCKMMTKQVETLILEMISLDMSVFPCYTMSRRKRKRRRKKRL